jgi:Ribosomal L32p protein family.
MFSNSSLFFISDFNVAVTQISSVLTPKPVTKLSLKELFDTSILWAVPKKRRSLERRMNRKYGSKDQVWKMLMPRTDLTVCNTCGYTHHSKTLCGKYYSLSISRVKCSFPSLLKVMYPYGLTTNLEKDKYFTTIFIL